MLQTTVSWEEEGWTVPYTEQQAKVLSENVRAWEVVTQEMLNCQEVNSLYLGKIINVSFVLGHRLPAKCKLNVL